MMGRDRDRGGRGMDSGPDKTDSDWRARPSSDMDDGPRRDDSYGESEFICPPSLPHKCFVLSFGLKWILVRRNLMPSHMLTVVVVVCVGSRDRYESDRFRDGPRRDDRYEGGRDGGRFRDRYDDRGPRDYDRGGWCVVH